MMLVKAQERAREAGVTPPPSGPSMATYSPVVERLDRVIDAVKFGAHGIIRATSGGKGGEAPKPEPRPTTAMEIARYRVRQERHDMLKRRMLPHIYGSSEN